MNVARFVVYSSAQAHCSVEKAAIIAGVKYHPVQVAFDDQLSLTGDALAGLGLGWGGQLCVAGYISAA